MHKAGNAQAGDLLTSLGIARLPRGNMVVTPDRLKEATILLDAVVRSGMLVGTDVEALAQALLSPAASTTRAQAAGVSRAEAVFVSCVEAAVSMPAAMDRLVKSMDAITNRAARDGALAAAVQLMLARGLPASGAAEALARSIADPYRRAMALLSLVEAKGGEPAALEPGVVKKAAMAALADLNPWEPGSVRVSASLSSASLPEVVDRIEEMTGVPI
jgi:hypothetical protein